MKRRVWLVTGALLVVAAAEFGLVGVGSAGAFFPWHRSQPPGCGRPFFPCKATATSTPTRVPSATPTRPAPPVSPPACLPDAQHGHDQACERQPASIQLTPDPLTIHCDGSEQSRLTVRVTDSKGRAVPDGTTRVLQRVQRFGQPVRGDDDSTAWRRRRSRSTGDFPVRAERDRGRGAVGGGGADSVLPELEPGAGEPAAVRPVRGVAADGVSAVRDADARTDVPDGAAGR